MNPVISPWVFYLTSFCDTLRIVCLAAGILALFVWVIGTVAKIANATLGDKDSDYLIGKTVSKLMLPIWIVGLTIGILCPSEKTITKMVVAENVTYERVEQAGDVVKDVYHDILDLFDKEDTDD